MGTPDNLAYERKRLVLTTVADAVHVTASPRRAPSVESEEPNPAAVRGNYDGRHNKVRIRVPGFLDEPAVEDDTIRAAVLHEIGHWADRWGLPSDYGIAAGWLMSIAGTIAYAVGCVLAAQHRSALGIETMSAGR